MEPTADAKVISVSLRAAVVRGKPPGTGPLCCLNCQSPLDLYQPDIDSPGRLVGICQGCSNECGCCHVIESDDMTEILMVMIPTFEAIREAICEAIVVPTLVGLLVARQTLPGR